MTQRAMRGLSRLRPASRLPLEAGGTLRRALATPCANRARATPGRRRRTLAALLVAAACSAEPLEERTPAGQTHVYRCADGFRFVVRFEPQRAWLFFDGVTKSVPQIPTRSGLLYTNRQITFAKSGSEARLTMEGGAEHVTCVNQPAEAETALK